jgi:hypothetical protein
MEGKKIILFLSLVIINLALIGIAGSIILNKDFYKDSK